MSDQFAYRPGLTFKSPITAYQYVVRPTKHVYAQDGTVIDTIPELVAEFGTHGAEYQYTDPDGNLQWAADIRGGFFNLDVQAEEKGWSDDDRALVARILLKNQAKFAGEYQLHSAAPLPAPWPTYDGTHHSKIAAFAAELGFVEATLAYEKQNKNRPAVVKQLEEEIAKATVADDLVAA